MKKISRLRRFAGLQKQLLGEQLLKLGSKAGRQPLPGLVIIGAQKAGTSSLHHYLSSHPLLTPSIRKEVRYFSLDSLYQKGLSWYKNQFPYINDPNIIPFEATPDYLNSEKSADRIHNDLPQVKLIAILRNPTKRAISSWAMYQNLRHDPFSRKVMLDRHMSYFSESQKVQFTMLATDLRLDDFDYCIKEELSTDPFDDLTQGLPFIRTGMYYERLTPYFNRFGHDQLLVLDARELYSDTKTTLTQICDFLGVADHSWKDSELKPFNKRENQPVIPEDSIQFLDQWYAPHNEKLFELIGKKFDW